MSQTSIKILWKTIGRRSEVEISGQGSVSDVLSLIDRVEAVLGAINADVTLRRPGATNIDQSEATASPYISIRQASKRLHIAAPTISRAIENGQLLASRPGKKNVLLRWEDLLDWIDSCPPPKKENPPCDQDSDA